VSTQRARHLTPDDHATWRIGIIASARHPIAEPFAGGLEVHTHALATGLRARGHEVRVFASATSDPELGVDPVCTTESRLDLSPAARLDVSTLSHRFMEEHHAYLHLMLRLGDSEWDVVQNNSLHYLPPAMAACVPAPFVTTLHTPPTPWLESAVSVGPPEPNAHFVAVSEHTAEQWGTNVQVGGVIPNGIDLHRWSFRSGGDRDTAVWTGRIVPEKGTHLALEAAHAAGLRLVVAGPVGDAAYFADEVQPRLEPRDRYAGHLDHDDLAELVGSAGVLLCTPCWEEPYGLVVAEALACGTPVAAFDRGAMRELVDEDCGRLAARDDVDGLARAALEARSLDRRACRTQAERHCSVEVMVDRYEQLYAGLLAA
jgi:glycosyltransferase involved in cell wall biosynthesis